MKIVRSGLIRVPVLPLHDKICKVCGIRKKVELFTKEPRNKNGLGAKCKECFNARQRELYPNRCLKRPLGSKQYEYHKRWNKKWIRTFNGWLSIALRSCRARNECSLTCKDIENLWDEQQGLCAMTGQPMDYKAKQRSHNRPSIDRIDNAKGYHLDNIRLVWHFVNQAKNVFTDKQLVKFCELVVVYNKENGK